LANKLSIEDLEKVRQRAQKAVFLRKSKGKARIIVHMGTCGIASGARKIMSTLLTELEKRKLQDVIVVNAGCAGLCSKEPMITVEMKNQAPVKYIELTTDKIVKILDEHIVKGKVVKEYALAKGSEKLF